jgi:hypothetical protein
MISRREKKTILQAPEVSSAVPKDSVLDCKGMSRHSFGVSFLMLFSDSDSEHAARIFIVSTPRLCYLT